MNRFETCLKFVEAIHTKDAPGQIEVRSNLPDGGRSFHFKNAEGLRPFLEELVQRNKQGAQTLISLARREGTGTTADESLPGNCVGADFDNGLGKDFALKAIEAAGLPPPTFIVETSPGKVHCFWVLESLLASVAEFVAIQKGLAEKLSTDPNICNGQTMLRLPGPFKSEKSGTYVRVLEGDPERRYFKGLFPQVEQEDDDREPVEWACEIVPEVVSDLAEQLLEGDVSSVEVGTRNDLIFQAVLDLAARHRSEAELHDLAQVMGGRLDLEPLAMKKLKTTVRSVLSRKKKRGLTPLLSSKEFCIITDLEELTALAQDQAPTPLEKTPPAGLVIDEIEAHSVRGPEPEPEARIDVLLGHPFLRKVFKATDPFTEGHPMAIALQTLAEIGNTFGRSVHVRVGEKKHHTNISVLVHGKTGRGRKGTGLAVADAIMEKVDPTWFHNRRLTRVSTPEGLIDEVMDDVVRREPGGGETVVTPGVDDKRLMVCLEELSSFAKKAQRKGNDLSEFFREVWDSPHLLKGPSRGTKIQATGSLISIIAHVTPENFRSMAHFDLDVRGGSFNRFIFCHSRRLKKVDMTPCPHLPKLQEEIQKTLRKTRSLVETGVEIPLDDEAKAIFQTYREELDEKLGREDPLADIIARADCQALRLALILAMCRGGSRIEAVDLNTAKGLLDYSEASARHLLGVKLGQNLLSSFAESIQVFVEKNAGCTKTDVYRKFNGLRRRDGVSYQEALEELLEAGKIRAELETPPGKKRALTRFFPAAQEAVQSFNTTAPETANFNTTGVKHSKNPVSSEKTAVSGLNTTDTTNTTGVDPEVLVEPQPSTLDGLEPGDPMPPGTYSLEDFVSLLGESA